MISPIATILHKHNREENKPLNILTSFTHENWETNLCKTGHNFYAYFTEGLKRWNDSRPLPQNYHRLRDNELPDVDIDLVLSQQKFGQYQTLKPIADRLHCPLVCIEHTDRMKFWDDDVVVQLKKMKGDINVFITEYSRNQFGWGEDEALVIRHGVDVDLFCPGEKKRKGVILSVVNDWIGRDVICGYSTWRRVTEGLPTRPIGDTKGFSEPSKSVEELVGFYQSSRVFINTSLMSPLPCVLLEAAACGCGIISTDNCAISELITHGVSGFLSNDEKELRKYCQILLNDEKLAQKMGENARKTVIEKFGLNRFVSEWDDVLKRASNIIYKG